MGIVLLRRASRCSLMDGELGSCVGAVWALAWARTPLNPPLQTGGSCGRRAARPPKLSGNGYT